MLFVLLVLAFVPSTLCPNIDTCGTHTYVSSTSL
jgi:hypothetical protein